MRATDVRTTAEAVTPQDELLCTSLSATTSVRFARDEHCDRDEADHVAVQLAAEIEPAPTYLQDNLGCRRRRM
jgi:hypothetical protein